MFLVNAVRVPKIPKNFVSVSLLYKRGGKALIELNKIILSKSYVFVEKGYVSDGMLSMLILIYGIQYLDTLAKLSYSL